MFGYGIDKRTLYVVLAIFALVTILTLGTSGILDIALSIPAVLIALTFHEFAHAFSADKLGDDTPRIQGRLNLNPLSHVDWIGLIMLVVAGFGWGKPVEINRRNFSNNKISSSAAEAIVAIAGPIMNFLIAFVFTIIYGALVTFTQLNIYVEIVLFNIIIINISLGLFNLIPIPPLDGSKVLMHFLPYNAKQWFENNQFTFYIIMLMLVFVKIGGVSVISQILTPAVSGIFEGFAWVTTKIIGLFI